MPSPSSAVVVAGGFGIDTNVYALGSRVGAEVTFAHIIDAPGQAGCYSALAFAALGVPTRAVAALGADHAGARVRDALAARGVALTELRDPVACRDALRGARLLHCHLDDWCRHLLPMARHEGLIISCDLQDALEVDDPYRADFVAAADVIFLSAVNLPDPPAMAHELAGRRAGRIVVVGAGAAGCLVAAGGRVAAHPAAQLAAPVIDTNGAGDTLAATFLASHVLEGLGIDDALWRAQLAARAICAQRGDEKSPLSRPLLEALVRDHATDAG